MRLTDTMALLTVLEQFQYVDNKEIAVQAWSMQLADDMPLQLAIATINRYYGQQMALGEKLPPILPGMLNKAWHEVKQARHDKQVSIEGHTEQPNNPMPAWFKDAMMEAFGHANVGGMGTPAPGTRTRSKGEVQAIFDRHALGAGIDLAAVRDELDGAA